MYIKSSSSWRFNRDEYNQHFNSDISIVCQNNLEKQEQETDQCPKTKVYRDNGN